MVTARPQPVQEPQGLAYAPLLYRWLHVGCLAES
jgi:hypothetical protein